VSTQLAPDGPLSPELVLVLPPELRARVLADLGPPVRPTPRRRAIERATPAVVEPLAPSLGAMLVARIGQLALIFVVVTLLVLAMALVANAMRLRPAAQARPIDTAVQTGHSGRSESPPREYMRTVWRYT
jgi:hypothetical protein